MSGRSALMIASQSKRASEETRALAARRSAHRAFAGRADGRAGVDFAAAGGRWNIVALLDPEYPRPANDERAGACRV